MHERNAPAITSISAGIRLVTETMRAIEFANVGIRPFSYSYYFDDRDRTRTGPMTGVVWARNEQNARLFVARDSNGGVYGYDIVILPLPWDADKRRKCATDGCRNYPGGNEHGDEYTFCDICDRLNRLLSTHVSVPGK